MLVVTDTANINTPENKPFVDRASVKTVTLGKSFENVASYGQHSSLGCSFERYRAPKGNCFLRSA